MKRVIVTYAAVAGLILGVAALQPKAGPDEAHAATTAHASHLVVSRARAVKIMRGVIADECPGRNHLICFSRQDAFVYQDSPHCWRWNTLQTHLEGNNPWFFKRWYGSEGQVCHGSMKRVGSYHREYRT